MKRVKIRSSTYIRIGVYLNLAVFLPWRELNGVGVDRRSMGKNQNAVGVLSPQGRGGIEVWLNQLLPIFGLPYCFSLFGKARCSCTTPLFLLALSLLPPLNLNRINHTNKELLLANTQKKRRTQRTGLQYDGQGARVLSLEDVCRRKKMASWKGKKKTKRLRLKKKDRKQENRRKYCTAHVGLNKMFW